MTLHGLLREAEEELKRAGVREYGTDAWYLLSEAFSLSRADYFLHRDEETADGARAERFRKTVRERAARVPLQQIIGYQIFMGLKFEVGTEVLIPRQDTEILAEAAMAGLREAWRETGKETVRALDLCTGSGCVGISLERLSGVPAEVIGTDISKAALALARKNGERLGCRNYTVLRGDLFAGAEGKFDVIVSNPPYIPTAVIGTLEEEVRLHEPVSALDGGADGLEFYRRIAKESGKYLTAGGRLYLEIGDGQGAPVAGLLAEAGFEEIRVGRDLAGLERIVSARRKGLEGD